MPLDALLVNPYVLVGDPTQRRQRSPFPPLGLMYVAAALREAGFSVKILDCTFMKTLREAEFQIEMEKPSAVGIYSIITLTRNLFRIAASAKRLGIKVIVGGPDASLRPKKYIETGLVDYVVYGEGERTAVDLWTHILSGKEPRGVAGVVYRDNNGHLVRNPPRPTVKNLDELPSPARDLIDNQQYKSVWMNDHGYALTSIMTSRGCPWGCHFCSNPVAPFGRRYNVVSPKKVVDEIEECVTVWGYNYIWIADDVFTVLKGRTMEICKGIIERNLSVKWSCLTRADRVDEQVLRAMKMSGCEIVFFGVESGADYMLKAMNRGMTIRQLEKGLFAAKRVGLRIHTFLQVGFPGETYQSLRETIRFVKKVNPDEFSFTISYPLPGTKLAEMTTPIAKAYTHSLSPVEWDYPSENKLLFRSNIPEWTLRFMIWKAKNEFYANRRVNAGSFKFKVLGKIFSLLTDMMLWLAVPPSAHQPKPSQCPVASRVVEIAVAPRAR